jgi:hypothetical protein
VCPLALLIFTSGENFMNTKMTSLVAGIALLAGVGIANAEERLTAASMDGVTAAGYSVPTFQFSKRIETDVDVNIDINKDIDADVDIDGHIADGEAYAICWGYDCIAETLTVTETTPVSGESYSGSLSATD